MVVGVGQAKQVRGETLKPRASGSVIGEPECKEDFLLKSEASDRDAK